MSTDYVSWLADPANDAYRNLLVDVDAWSGGGEVTRKMSLLDAPAAGAYLPVLVEIPVFTTRFRQPWGEPTREFSKENEVQVHNEDGLFDAWLFDAWGGRNIVLRHGDVRWTLADYQEICTGTMLRVEADGDQMLRLVFQGRFAKLDRQIQLNTVDDGENGEIEIPLAYGYLQQARPVLTDKDLDKYQVHDGAVEDASVGALWIDGDENALSYSENNGAGVIDLSADPGGVLTLITKGAKVGGTWLTKPGEIIRHILVEKGGLVDPDDLDTDAFDAFDVDKPVIGLYIDSPRNMLDVLDEICFSFDAWYAINNAGKLTIGQLKIPVGADSVMDLHASRQQILGPIEVSALKAPRYATRLGYARAWTINSSTNPNINPEDREHFRRGYKVVEYVDPAAATIQAVHLDAEIPEVEQTLIAYESDALDRAEHRQGLFNGVGYDCRVRAAVTPFQIDIGRVITVYDDRSEAMGRYGFDLGRPILVRGLTALPGQNQTLIEGWFRDD